MLDSYKITCNRELGKNILTTDTDLQFLHYLKMHIDQIVIRLLLNLSEAHSFSFKFVGKLLVSTKKRWKDSNNKVSRNLIINGVLISWLFKRIRHKIIVGIQRVRKALEIEK
jgi:hypothetical protein